MKENLQEKIYNTFRALKSRNYRLFFAGQCISLIGTWVQNIAMSWLVYTLTKSAFLMGLITFVNAIPSLIISPFAGVIVDRVNKYKALIIIQALFGIQALLIAILTLSELIQIWHIVIMGFFIGIVAAFDMPMRQSLVIQLVENKKDLSNAISLNSSSFNLARLIGPAFAGVLIASFNEGICFLINAISYIAVIYALLLIKLPSINKRKEQINNFLYEMKEGLKYAAEYFPIRCILIYLSIASFLGMSYPLLMPIFAKEVLNGDAKMLGFLMSAAGIGALGASLYLASKKSVLGLPQNLLTGSVLLASGLLGLKFLHNIYMSSMLLFVIGYGMVSIMITSNTLLQHYVDNDKRGRIMSLYTIAFIGTVPVSNLFAGIVAEKIGVLNTFLVFGLLMATAIFVFAKKIKQLPDS